MEPKKKKGFFDNIIGGIKKWASTPREINIPARNPNQISPLVEDWKAPQPKIATNIQPTIAQAKPTPTPQPEPYIPQITVPGKEGTNFTLPASKAQVLLNSFNDIGEATNAARVMVHPYEQTFTPKEVQRIGRENWTYGENPELNMKAPTILQTGNNTYDTGALRVNSGTLNEMLSKPVWRQKLLEKGITNFEELQYDPQKNADAARIRLEYGNWDNEMKKIKQNPNWRHWYAAPLELRNR